MRGARRAPSVRDMEPWQPAKPRFRPVRLILGWIVAAAAIWITAAILPGFALDSTGAAFLGAAVIALINAVLPPVLAALRLPFMLATGFLLVLAANAAALMIARERVPRRHPRRGLGRRAARRAPDRRGDDGARRRPRHERRRRVLAARDPADRAPRRRRDPDRGARHRLPRDRRPRPAGAARRDARRQRPQHGPLDRRGRLPARRVGDRPVVADRREPGGDPARLERGHPRVPLGREGVGPDHDLLLPRRLRRDRAAPRDRDRAAARRRRQPREPALRRGGRDHPDRQPDGRGEAREPRLPRLPRERLQRHPRARAVLLGGRAGAHREHPRRPPRHPPARPPRRHLPAHARRALRRRARPDRVRRADRHDAGPPRGLRDVLELRRGRPPLRARARRHDGGAAQARRAVRPDRPRAAVRGASLRDRRPLRPRPDAGRHLQAAPRLRARRAGRAVADRRPGRLDRRRGRAGRARRPGGRRGDRPQREAVEERGRRPAGRRARLGQPRPRLPDGAPRPDDRRGDRGAPPAAARRAPLASARRLAARALGGARRARARPGRHPQPGHRRGRGRGPARALLADRGEPSRQERRLRARRRHHGRLVLRPGARRGLRVRGADLLPRRPRRPADAAVHPGAAAARAARGADPRRRRPSTRCWRAGARSSRLRTGRAPRAPARRSRPPSATTRRACGRPRWPAS